MIEKMLADRNITLDLPMARARPSFVVGCDWACGARPLKRTIRRMVLDKLAIEILEGGVLHGEGVRVEAGKLSYRVHLRRSCGSCRIGSLGATFIAR